MPLREDGDTVAERLGLLDVMCRQEDRHAIPRHILHERPDAAAHLRVKRDRRLVEEQDARPVQEGAHDEQAPLHAARESPNAIVDDIRELDVAQELLDARAPLCPRHVMQARMKLQVLPDREVLVEVDVLRHDADQGLDAPCIMARVEAVVADDPRRRLCLHRHHADGRRLARAIGAEQAEDLAAPDAHRQVIDGRLEARPPVFRPMRELLAEMLHFYHIAKNPSYH